jgi:predicted DNA binding CopG/RHH family protein
MKNVPKMTTDKEAEGFLDQDLSGLDFRQFRKVNWEALAKTARINMRLPEGLIAAVKARAALKGIPYQRLIREALEREVAKKPS